eukprot:7946312-Pyramimonas_sp.AAC.1
MADIQKAPTIPPGPRTASFPGGRPREQPAKQPRKVAASFCARPAALIVAQIGGPSPPGLQAPDAPGKVKRGISPLSAARGPRWAQWRAPLKG